MSTIVTRSGKGSPLTHTEVDDNFTNLNTDKYQSGDAVSFTTLTATGQTSLGGVAGSEGLRVTPVASAVSYLNVTGDTGTIPTITAAGAGTNIDVGISSKGNTSGRIRFYTNSSAQEQFRVSHTASAVNYVQVTGAATGGFAAISTQGSDASVGLNVISKGALGTTFATNGSSTNIQFRVLHAASAVNRVDAVGSATGISPVVSVSGSDTNISQVFQSKGTGAIDLAAGSSGVNISNGGTVTALTVTAAGSGYTTIPTPAITAPTTAGGVQAVATATMNAINRTIVSGGTGYTLNDTITVVGGTFTTAATFTVSAVSGGVVTALAASNGGTYSVLPTGTLSTTGGTGTGLTLTIDTWGVRGLTIGTAGSGYVEQPTVTFSGGGGSGAAAYATVGSGTVVRSLGAAIDFYTAQQQIGFRVQDFSGSAGTGYWTAFGGNVTPILRAVGTGSGSIQTNGATPIQFGTNNGVEQLRVAHTASAVNYVQVTGAATGGFPRISTQGSDSSASLAITAKSGTIWLETVSGFGMVGITHTAGANNYLALTGGVNTAPSISAASGTNANIDLALTPKGTGNVRFGTYTANMALTVQGYIEIKDSGGTVRKLAVIA